MFIWLLISEEGIHVHGLCKQLTDKTAFLKEEIKIACNLKRDDNITNVKW